MTQAVALGEGVALTDITAVGLAEREDGIPVPFEGATDDEGNGGGVTEDGECDMVGNDGRRSSSSSSVAAAR